MAAQLGVPHLTPVHGPDRAGALRHSYADLARAGAELGYEPIVNFVEGLRLTLDWYQSAS